MARTILDIAKEAAERDASAPAPSTLFGTNDRIARILRGAAKDTMREFLRNTNWQGNSELHSTWVWNLLPNRFAYELPPDWLRAIPYTEQRNGWPLGIIGPTSPRVWASWLYGGQAVSGPMGWRIKNNLIYIEPIPTEAELVTIEYISKFPVVGNITTDDVNLASDPPSVISPLVPRDGYMADIDPATVPRDNPTDVGTFGEDPGWDVGTFGEDVFHALRRLSLTSQEAPLPMVRRAEFESDSDLPAWEDDYLLSLGMTFRLRRALGLPYEEHAAEFEAEMQLKAAHDAGGNRNIRFGCDETDMFGYQVPLGGSRWLID